MEHDVEQDIEDEKGASPEVAERKRRGRKPKVSEPVVESRDHGEWKFKPWNGLDHWVHERTGASTFHLKKVK
ncbi:hypothetical protein [Rhizobium azibense]|uniref:Uncharacterized protein n=1 Tax=Rhizobium azibense TaxID=1136135 RepID=A0A4V2VDV2_9HYPH|nr:hypothetical protein [Rhizobium azibense]TCU34165.1 hypothetical protein EV129_113150 [Rhizobium azibense]